MFDKPTFVIRGSEHHTHSHRTTVTEHRAPTDESVRLLQEMQQKALDSILANTVLKDNGIEAKLYLLHDPLNGIKSVIIIKLNGVELRSEVVLQPWCDTTEERVLKIRDALATTLANHLLSGMLGSMDRQTRAALEYSLK